MKYEHSSGNLECLKCPNKLSAQIAVQHTDVALLSVLMTHYCIPKQYIAYFATSHVAQKLPLILSHEV